MTRSVVTCSWCQASASVTSRWQCRLFERAHEDQHGDAVTFRHSPGATVALLVGVPVPAAAQRAELLAPTMDGR